MLDKTQNLFPPHGLHKKGAQPNLTGFIYSVESNHIGSMEHTNPQWYT